MSSEWKFYAVCPECGWKTYAPFASLFHANVKCCPECGTDEDDFSLKKMRFNDKKVKLLKPSTWGTGYWEIYKK